MFSTKFSNDFIAVSILGASLIHVPRIPPPLNYLARINESEGGGMNRFMSVYNTFVGV